MGIRDSAFEGKPVDVFVIDAHTHILEYYMSAWYQNPVFTSNTAVIRLMDRLGIDCIVTAPHSMIPGFMYMANRAAELAASEFEGRIYGYISICPNEGLEAVRQAIRKYSSNDRFIGLKLLPGYHGSLEQEEYEYAMDFANEAGCPLLCHVWSNVPSIEQFEKYLPQRPKMKLILAHQGGGNARMTKLYEGLIKNYENVYMELCGSLFNTLSVEEIIEITGEDRLIYGSDMINLDPRFDFGRVVLSTLSDEVMKKVLALNYLKVLEKSQMGRIHHPA